MKILCALMLAAIALAQTPAEKKPARVEGIVLNSLTGEPVRKAELTVTTGLMPDGVGFDVGMDISMDDVFSGGAATPKPDMPPKKTFTATSDANGKFHIDAVDPGNYYFQVKRAGFVEQTYKPMAANSADGMLRLTAGQELKDVEFRLVPQSALSGKVVDEDGDPVTNAMVTASKYTFATGHRTLMPLDSGQANDRGEFRLGKLPPGRYFLSAEVMSFNPMAATPPEPKDGSPEMAYINTYFPRNSDVQEAESIEVKAGSDTPGFVIHLQKGRVVRVKGTMLGEDGKPLKQAQVMLMSGARPGSMRMATVNDAEGKFEIANVPPGAYTAMTVQLFGSASGKPAMTMQPLIVGTENMTGVKLGTTPEASLNGKVSVTGDGKVSLKGVFVMLGGDEDGALMPSTGRVEDSGAFTLKKVSPAIYRPEVSNIPAGAYLKSIQWNGREKLGEPLDLSAGVAGDIQVILATDGATFDAKVMHDDKPVRDVTVVLLPEDAGRRNPHNTKSEETSDTGHVVFKDVPPGNYLAFAWEKVEEGDWFDPVFIKAAAKDGVRVTLGSRDNQHLDLKSIPPR